MSLNRSISISLITALAVIAPTTALAQHGADDPAGSFDDNGGVRADKTPGGNRLPGKCTGHSTAKLKVKPDNGRLETEFEVDQNRNGVTWKATIRRNGHVAVRRNMTTRAPSGSGSPERRLTNGSGRERVTARAVSPSGQVCTASLSI